MSPGVVRGSLKDLGQCLLNGSLGLGQLEHTVQQTVARAFWDGINGTRGCDPILLLNMQGAVQCVQHTSAVKARPAATQYTFLY